jgi:hypothetical protein
MHRDGAIYGAGTLESIRFLRFEPEFAQQETECLKPPHAPVLESRLSTMKIEFERKDRSSKGNGSF